MCRWALQCRFRQFEKDPNFVVGQALSSSYSSCVQLLSIEVQYMFTLICMRYPGVSVNHRTMTRTTRSLTCLHDILMHVYTHVFCLS